MTDMGADWRRKFCFRVPVRRLDVWTRSDVRDALVETFSFLSEDEYAFDFVQAIGPTGLQPYLGLRDPSAQTISPDEVILFSGGLDSLAGAVDELIGNQRRVVLVSHRSSTMIASKQNNLVAKLRERTKPGQLFYVPVTINKGQEEAAEFTQRSRSLLFAALGLIVARMFGKNKLSFFENGVVSFNLPIAEHVLGAGASRTTHPRVLADCSRLFSRLLSENVTIQNPYVWKTKAEVVQVLADRGCTDLISETISCARVREATKQGRHCGTCSQCVDRRFSILAGGLGEYEPADNYLIDLFKGQHKTGSDLTLVECYVVRAQKVATMSEQAFLASYGQVYRALAYLQGTPDDNVRRIYELYRRYGQQVIEVVDRELKNNASLVQALSLPETSLLAMIMSSVAKQPDYLDPIEKEQSASMQAAGDTQTIVRQPLVFAIDRDGLKVIFGGGPELKGSGFQLVRALAKEFEDDVEAGVTKEAFRFIKTSELTKRLCIDEQSLRKRISRTRQMLERQFLERCDIQLDDDDVIQNEEWKGYRLNPYLLLVKPTQMQGTEKMSQPGTPLVTTSLSSR